MFFGSIEAFVPQNGVSYIQTFWEENFVLESTVKASKKTSNPVPQKKKTNAAKRPPKFSNSKTKTKGGKQKKQNIDFEHYQRDVYSKKLISMNKQIFWKYF